MILVFVIEKLVYVVSWIYWWTDNYGQANKIYNDSFPAWFFLSGYGIIDVAFGLFFLWVYLSPGRRDQAN